MDKVIIITGATACGKTGAAVETALNVNGEVVSADSMQVYRYMDIGTATPAPEEMRGVKHWLISEVNPDEEFNVSVYVERARRYIADIVSRGKTPVVCGGTGFYINALLYGNDFGETDLRLREELLLFAEQNGANALHSRLKAVDEAAAGNIHPNNVRRVARALEFFMTTGGKISEHNEREKQREPFYEADIRVMEVERQALYAKIERRVDLMLERGLVAEVERLLAMGYDTSLTSMQGLGYKEIARYIKGEYPLETAVEMLKQGTRRYAKRQITWFRHQL